jgi:hypothetical protein
VLMHGANHQLTTLGRLGIIRLSAARDAAKTILAKRTLGKHQPRRIAYDDALETFLEHAEQKDRPRIVQDYKRLLNRHFRFGRKRLADISQQEIMRRIYRLGDTIFSNDPIAGSFEAHRSTSRNVRVRRPVPGSKLSELQAVEVSVTTPRRLMGGFFLCRPTRSDAIVVTFSLALP